MTHHGPIKDIINILLENTPWENTALGPRHTWSPSLTTVVNLCVASATPICIYCGEQGVQLYNDAFSELLDLQHPNAFGQPIDNIETSFSHNLVPAVRQVMQQQESVRLGPLPVVLHRQGFPHERDFLFSCSPALSATNEVEGVFVIASAYNETDDKTPPRATHNVDDAARMSLALESTHIGTWEYNPVDNVLIWSEECRRIYAIPADVKIDFRIFEEHIFSTDRQRVEDAINASLAGVNDGKYDIEYRIVRYADQGIRWIRSQGQVHLNDQRVATRFVGTVMDITDSKDYEKSLQESELQVRLAVESAGIGTFSWHIPSLKFEYSDKQASMFGFAGIKNLYHEKFKNRIHPDDQAIRTQAIETAFKTGNLHYEARIVWDDDSIHWIRATGKVLFDEYGKPDKMYGTTIDISREKEEALYLEKLVEERMLFLEEKNKALQQSEERYHRVITEIEDYAIILLDVNGLIQNWNRGAEKIKLYREDEILGRHISTFYLPEDKHVPGLLINEAITNGRSGHEGWRVRKDGTRFWGHVTITALHNDHDDVIGFAKVTRDLTERKIAEEELKLTNEELRKSEEQYHRMIAEIQDYAIILLDSDGIILNWNKGAEKIKLFTQAEIVGHHFRIFYLPDDRANKLPEKLIKDAALYGRALHEGWRIRKDGSRFWGNIVITALHGKDGSVIGFSKITRDLTERKNADDTLRQYSQELELQNKELEQFAYVASHDLQEPLRKIQIFAEIIQRNARDEANVQFYLDKITASSHRMSELIRSLLGFSRLAAEFSSFVDVDLNAVLDDIKQDLELVISEKEARVISDVLPVVKGIDSQLHQLFANLISNGLKFNRGKPIITIRSNIVSHHEVKALGGNPQASKYAKVSFHDNGIGFDEQFKEKIFTIFQRLHTQHEFTGTGIGLALCKKIVDHHHGFIAASSVPGEGATFLIFLPV